MSMQLALNVNDSTSDQLPSTTTESTNSVQQTRTSEGLTAPAQPNTTSAADQQQLMNFLYSESSGSVYSGPTNEGVSTGQTFARLGIGSLIVIVAVILAVFCQGLLESFNAKPKAAQKRRTTKKR